MRFTEKNFKFLRSRGVYVDSKRRRRQKYDQHSHFQQKYLSFLAFLSSFGGFESRSRPKKNSRPSGAILVKIDRFRYKFRSFSFILARHFRVSKTNFHLILSEVSEIFSKITFVFGPKNCTLKLKNTHQLKIGNQILKYFVKCMDHLQWMMPVEKEYRSFRHCPGAHCMKAKLFIEALSTGSSVLTTSRLPTENLITIWHFSQFGSVLINSRVSFQSC